MLLAERGYDADFGARPLKRLIQKTVSDAAALLILDGKAAEGDTIVVDVAEESFGFGEQSCCGLATSSANGH